MEKAEKTGIREQVLNEIIDFAEKYDVKKWFCLVQEQEEILNAPVILIWQFMVEILIVLHWM